MDEPTRRIGAAAESLPPDSAPTVRQFPAPVQPPLPATVKTGRLFTGTAAEPPPEQLPADVPGYDVLEEIGRGGMGVVYRARHQQLNRDVALKMVLHGGLAAPEHRRRFLAEAEAVARLSHPGIVQVYDF